MNPLNVQLFQCWTSKLPVSTCVEFLCQQTQFTQIANTHRSKCQSVSGALYYTTAALNLHSLAVSCVVQCASRRRPYIYLPHVQQLTVQERYNNQHCVCNRNATLNFSWVVQYVIVTSLQPLTGRYRLLSATEEWESTHTFATEWSC